MGDVYQFRGFSNTLSYKILFSTKFYIIIIQTSKLKVDPEKESKEVRKQEIQKKKHEQRKLSKHERIMQMTRVQLENEQKKLG